MKLPITSRLSYRLARNTIILAVLIGMLLSLIQVLIDYLNEKNSLDQEIRAIITISHAPASQIAYNIDTRLAGELLEGLLLHPAIIHAEIIDTDNRILASKDRALEMSSHRWLSDALFQSTRIYSESLFVPQLKNVILGDINVVVDTHPGGTIFLKRAGFTLMSGFTRSLILSAVLIVLFYIMLTKPLVKVIGAVSEVGPESPEKIRLPVPKGHESDEIGVLVNSTNTQLQAVEENLEKLKKAESRLKTYSEQLEQIVESRTKELSEKNRQLIKTNHEMRIAKEEAVNRAKARAEFLANMSHEIRTPFNGVLGMISLAMEDPLTDRQKEQLNVAYSSGVSLLELLDDILDISKVEAGKLTLENIDFDLRELIEEIAGLLAPSAQNKGVTVITEVDPAFPERVFGDPTRLRQVISNLLGNAIKFTNEGEISILVFQREDRQVQIDVKDTGIGIPADRLESIFSPFLQAHSDTTRKYGGTGLGLTLCRQLATHMGGDIFVDSVQKTGSKFSLCLPLKTDPNVEPPKLKPGAQEKSFTLIHHVANNTFSMIIANLTHWGCRLKVQTYADLDELKFNGLAFTEGEVIFVDDVALFPTIAAHKQKDEASFIWVARPPSSTVTDSTEFQDLTKIIRSPLSRSRLMNIINQTVELESNHIEQPVAEVNAAQVSNHHILLVEDNQVNQLVAKAILGKLGYQVSIAQHGAEALEKVNSNTYDVILMDCHMPVMDGYEATRQIRRLPQFDNIPIIAVTANVMQGDKEKCFGCGMNDYITKPYEKKTLLQVLEKWIAEQK